MTYYNFKSIFAWTSSCTPASSPLSPYIVDDVRTRFNDYTKHAGMWPFLWRLTLTTGNRLDSSGSCRA